MCLLFIPNSSNSSCSRQVHLPYFAPGYKSTYYLRDQGLDFFQNIFLSHRSTPPPRQLSHPHSLHPFHLATASDISS